MYKGEGNYINKYYIEALPLKHILFYVRNIGHSFVSLFYRISQKYMLIMRLPLDKIKYEFRTYNNKYYK
jgi:hypothetical protein